MTSNGCTETPLSHFFWKIQKPVCIAVAHLMVASPGAFLYMYGISKSRKTSSDSKNALIMVYALGWKMVMVICIC